MSWLYCTVCGRGHEHRALAFQADYRQQGESALIVHGTLKGGPYHCDQCNAWLKRGDAALMMTAFPKFLTEAMHEYDFGAEGRYFDLRRATLKLYGAAWPGGDPAALLRRQEDEWTK